MSTNLIEQKFKLNTKYGYIPSLILQNKMKEHPHYIQNIPKEWVIRIIVIEYGYPCAVWQGGFGMN